MRFCLRSAIKSVWTIWRRTRRRGGAPPGRGIEISPAAILSMKTFAARFRIERAVRKREEFSRAARRFPRLSARRRRQDESSVQSPHRQTGSWTFRFDGAAPTRYKKARRAWTQLLPQYEGDLLICPGARKLIAHPRSCFRGLSRNPRRVISCERLQWGIIKVAEHGWRKAALGHERRFISLSERPLSARQPPAGPSCRNTAMSRGRTLGCAKVKTFAQQLDCCITC